MILQFTIFHIILALIFPIFPPLTSAQQEDGIIAQQGCNSTCGTMSIPFPFGMKEPRCYADKWFEIECKLDNSSQNPKPYLKSLNLEVNNVYLDLGMVEIMNPIYHSNCQQNINNKTVTINLGVSPFMYSQSYNKFLAVGCNNLAFLQSNGTTVGGCVSICDDGNFNNNFNSSNDRCNGRYCCETSLPTHLSEYNATFQGLSEQSIDQCSYALILSDNWISFDGSYLSTFNELGNMEYAPAMLEWEILVNSTFQLPSDSYCYDSKVTSLNNRTTGRKCQCSSGYTGNPYIVGGCTGFSLYTFSNEIQSYFNMIT
ncbi:putative wall-associated receptor kinase, galacturonan-binding domain-containing protein [Medicago truncatula]|uniref:Putative wall-associated receptor kinase, galacturonan-binding domain-containing protein n=1 Tax=Medicago truncatula TaxID=3880 RepID=A0A396J8L4_MEDTR|nr:putative wall-associated receptor kinase, galacturonan-binding domain-containing protein [Medicago truncatula]